MPHFTVMIGSDGPTIDLAVAVGLAWQRRLATRGIPAPSPATVRALIDTGSDLSVLHPQVLQQFGVQATGSIRIRRPGSVIRDLRSADPAGSETRAEHEDR